MFHVFPNKIEGDLYGIWTTIPSQLVQCFTDDWFSVPAQEAQESQEDLH